jgi:hypothetical protein
MSLNRKKCKSSNSRASTKAKLYAPFPMNFELQSTVRLFSKLSLLDILNSLNNLKDHIGMKDPITQMYYKISTSSAIILFHKIKDLEVI